MYNVMTVDHDSLEIFDDIWYFHLSFFLNVNISYSYFSRGYPDQDYMEKVKGQLSEKNVTEDCLTENQKNFILQSRTFIKETGVDFGDAFQTKS